MKFSAFLTEADAALQQPLGNAGFRRVGAGVWNRLSGDDINVVSLQKLSSGGAFCVNLGVHYGFLPKAGFEAPLNLEAIDAIDCEVKLRLTAQATAKDQWWPVTPESASEIADLAGTRGLEVFDSYRLTGAISRIGAMDIENGSLGILSSLTKVRACLLLARIHERHGNLANCKELAALGLKIAGLAVAAKKPLRDILKRCERAE